MTLTPLTKPITRLVGDSLVVRLTPAGIELRGKFKRQLRKFVTWEQVAALDDLPSIHRAAEVNFGKQELKRLGAKVAMRDEG